MKLTKEQVIDKLIEVCHQQIGTVEKGGNNKGEDIRKYQTATWLTPGAWPWCAAFMCYVTKEWLKIEGVTEFLNIKSIDNWRCKDASAFGWIKWAKDRKLYLTDEKELAKKGDIIVFDFSHIGIVIENQISLNSSIKTIEGNTEPNSSKRDGTFDGVYQMNRSPKLVKAYIRIIE